MRGRCRCISCNIIWSLISIAMRIDWVWLQHMMIRWLRCWASAKLCFFFIERQAIVDRTHKKHWNALAYPQHCKQQVLPGFESVFLVFRSLSSICGSCWMSMRHFCCHLKLIANYEHVSSRCKQIASNMVSTGADYNRMYECL